MALPADSHVHSQWSWDAAHGDMERSCARAVELGVPAVAFTEHLDHSVWRFTGLDTLEPEHPLHALTDADGIFDPPSFDVAGYLESVERCREQFPDLRILTGLELGEPHWHAEQVAQVLASGPFDRVLGSLHGLPVDDVLYEPPGLLEHLDPLELMRRYLPEVAELAVSDVGFAVVAHVDYPLRYVDPAAAPDPTLLEDEFRHALRAIADSGRALELNTVIPLDETVLRWWHDEGGEAISFGSDAHRPEVVATGFADAAALAEACGFRPGSSPLELWARVD